MISLHDMILEVIKLVGGGIELPVLLNVLIEKRDISKHNQEKFAFMVFDHLAKKMPGIAVLEYSDYSNGGEAKYYVYTP